MLRKTIIAFGILLAMLLLLPHGEQNAAASFSEPHAFCFFAGAAWGWGSGEATDIAFNELYGSVSSRGLQFSDKVKNSAGKKVGMVGFMAPPLTPTIKFFVLTREPMSICPFCSSDADWPADIVVVKLKKPVKALPYDKPIKVTGTLELGTEVDAETGFVSLVRIASDKLEIAK